MTRQSQVVRSSTGSAGVAAGRAFPGGVQIFCATQSDRPTLLSSDGGYELVAPIKITSSENYTRCFVSATIDNIYVTVPDPPPVPGPGTWTVRFECPIQTTDGWSSTTYHTPAPDTTVNEIRWAHTGPEDTPGGVDYAYIEKEGDYYPYFTFRPESGTETMAPGTVPIDNGIWLHVRWQYGPMWVELALSSPHGEFAEDFTISDGGYD